MFRRKHIVEKKGKKSGVVSHFSDEFFFVSQYVNLVELHFCLSESFQKRYFLWTRGRKHQEYPSNSFCLTDAKIFCRASILYFRKTPVSRFSMHKKGGLSTISVETILPLSTKKIVRGTLLCFRKIPVSRFSWMEGRGGITSFWRVFFLTVL